MPTKDPWVSIRVQRGVAEPSLQQKLGLKVSLTISPRLEEFFKKASSNNIAPARIDALPMLDNKRWQLYDCYQPVLTDTYSWNTPIRFLMDEYNRPCILPLRAVGASKGIVFGAVGAFSESVISEYLQMYGRGVNAFLLDTLAPIDVSVKVT